MLRRLLACLALLTGLAAAGAPAQAEVAVAMASRIEASTTAAAVTRGASEAAMARPLPGRRFAQPRTAWPMLDLPFAIPSVHMGSDRSRE